MKQTYYKLKRRRDVKRGVLFKKAAAPFKVLKVFLSLKSDNNECLRRNLPLVL